MELSGIPYKFSAIWGSSAGGSYITNPIPTSGSEPQNATQAAGFPPITSIPITSGGIPPDITDFNGAYYYVTAWANWQQAGGPIQYDSAFSTAFGGYPRGATLANASTLGRTWFSLVDNNTSDPDTGGANWGEFGSTLLFAEVAEVYTAGTQGVNGTAHTWNQRVLNAVVTDPANLIGSGAVTLSGNTVTFHVAGKWLIRARGPCNSNAHQVALYNSTTSAYFAYGVSANSYYPSDVSGSNPYDNPVWIDSEVTGLLTTVAGTPQSVQLMHWLRQTWHSSPNSEPDFGQAVNTSFTGNISGTTLTIGTIGTNVVGVGDTITGPGVAAGTTITALGSGTGGTGTYTVSISQTIASGTTMAAGSGAPEMFARLEFRKIA